MLSRDDFEYAVENTRIILAPQQKIATFGSTVFHFHLISEVMDAVNQVRVRDGEIHAHKPEIVTPDTMSRLMLEGFGEKAEEFARFLQSQMGNLAILKYGFMVRKTDVTEDIVHDPLADVIDRVQSQVEELGNPMSAVIEGVDDAWEVCLLKFTSDIIRHSAGGNMEDFHGRGLI